MQKYLINSTTKPASFCSLFVDDYYTHTIYSGEVGTNGQADTQEFDSDEERFQNEEKLIEEKIKQGYTLLKDNDVLRGKWFENLRLRLFHAFKQDMLAKYPAQAYKSIQLHRFDANFALGLGVNSEGEEHEYLDADTAWYEEVRLTAIYKQLENIPDTEYDQEDDCEYAIEFERNEWPVNEEDCYELECFLTNVVLASVFLSLKEDPDLNGYLMNIEVVNITSEDRKLGLFSSHFQIPGFGPYTDTNVDNHIKSNVVNAFIQDEQIQQIVLGLWGDKANEMAAAFLKRLKQ